MAHWDDLADPHDPALERIAVDRHIHPLHLEDMRERSQRAKLEEGRGYLYVVLKLAHLDPGCEFHAPDLDLVLGRDWVLTVREKNDHVTANLLKPIHAEAAHLRADQIFHRVFDAVVDSYTPTLDTLDEEIDTLENRVLIDSSPEAVSHLFTLKRSLIELRRVLVNMRDLANHLQRIDSALVHRDLHPYLRDVYDHIARHLDSVETQRDLLSSALEVYLSTVANRTNQVMKVLTVIGTISIPAVVITGLYGMNMEGLPWSHSPHAFVIVILLIMVCSGSLLLTLRTFRWW